MNRDLGKKWRPVSRDGVGSVTNGIAKVLQQQNDEINP